MGHMERHRNWGQVSRTEGGQVRGMEEDRVHMERVLLLELRYAFASGPVAAFKQLSKITKFI